MSFQQLAEKDDASFIEAIQKFTDAQLEKVFVLFARMKWRVEPEKMKRREDLTLQEIQKRIKRLAGE